ncbi:MAG: T9SS type A sorting domain-containing protein [Ignavibacteriae bacterium]|nr:T9SS type A sorting domain-containing protein [Ignavibacteriota bacterium]
MKRVLAYIFLMFLLPALLFADTTRVLFVGNSYTYANDLPSMFKNLSSSLGRVVYTEMSAPGGYSFEQHLTDAETQLKISKGNWNFVVLQEQSQMPVIDFYRYYSTYPSARKLDSIIKSYNSNTMFFMTWGRRYGGIQCIDTSCSPPFGNFSHMQDSLSSAYLRIANELSAQVCQAGNVWKQSVNTDSSTVLWDTDFSHPSPAGSYLTACAFYTKIFNSSCIGSDYTAGLPSSTALYLQTIASNYVLKITGEGIIIPPEFILHKNYPNPFNSSTVIDYEVNKRTELDIDIYDAEGRLVERLFKGVVNQGRHRITWNAKSGLPSGIYFITLKNNVQIKTGKLIYLK